MLYDSRYKYFKGNLRTKWLGPYVIEKCHDNGLVQIRTIDAEDIPLLFNGHRLKVYKKPLSKKKFINGIIKIVIVVEQVLDSTPSNPCKKEKKKKRETEVKTSMRHLSPTVGLKTS